MAREDLSDAAESLVAYARRLCDERLAAYDRAPHDVDEHANIEENVLSGAYAYRQVAELIQNAADAVADGMQEGGNRIEILADRYGLWAANTGAPVDESGVRALLNSHSSNKRASQIGRFGLGFKSLLRLGGRIDVLSRSVCLHFDPAAARRKIRQHLSLPDNAKAPGMRLADAAEWSERLPAVEGADRFAWASTIVLSGIESPTARLAIFNEIKKFPEEFLLFLPCDVDLILTAGDTRRHLSRRTEADGCVVIEDAEQKNAAPQRWRVFETAVAIRDAAAIEDAREVHFRETVPLIWAAPLGTSARDGGRFRETRTGRFYAFFPTSTESRTLGILNAPWKLNNDRTALVEGDWNRALMEAASELIAGHIAELAAPDDPGAVLDGFPRELSGSSDPAAPLVNDLWKRLVDAPVIANCDGELCLPARLYRSPTDTPDLVAAWSELASPEACEVHVHPTCTATPARIGRLNQLSSRLQSAESDEPRLRKTDPRPWLELTASTDVSAAASVLRLADGFAREHKGIWWDSARASLRLILASDSSIAAAPEVVLGERAEPPLKTVHPLLSTVSGIPQILRERFHVRDASDVTPVQIIDRQIDTASETGDWSPVWQTLRKMPFEQACRIVRQRSIRVRTLGGWSPPHCAFRLGELVSADDIAAIPDQLRGEASLLVVDGDWHAQDHALLDEMGIEPNPDPEWSVHRWPTSAETHPERWIDAWRTTWVDKYHIRLGCKPSVLQLKPESFEMPLGWQWLLFLEGDRRQAITHWILESIEAAEEDEFGPVQFHHQNRYSYPAADFPHPLWALLLERGTLGQRDVTLPFSALLCERMPEIVSSLPSLAWWKETFDKLQNAATGYTSASGAEEVWPALLRYASRETCAPQALADFYNLAAEEGFVPAEICSETGAVPIADIYVAASERETELAGEAGLLAVHLSREAAARWKERGAADLGEQVSAEWNQEEPSETIQLADIEPALGDILVPGKAEQAGITLVRSLQQTLAGRPIGADWLFDNGTVVVDADAFREMGWRQRTELAAEIGREAGWIAPDSSLDGILESGPAAKRREVAAEPDLPSRLLKAVGGIEPLLRLYETELRPQLGSSPGKAAEISITLFGPSLLALGPIREAMTHEGLEPPTAWSGSKAADFVASIGFPPEYAVAPQRKREAELSVQGPIPLKELHDFQKDVVTHVDELLGDTESKRRRAVISLPTGAGKTRVAAETAVTRILRPNGFNRVVLWIAQSDELCEQAVQCFRQLWANLGSSDEPLRIVRFWGGQGNPGPARPDEPTVVVATIQTLDSRMGQAGIDWIRSPALVVIDECHHALTTAYTGTFHWLGGGRKDEPEPPVIGLSATPFRGNNEEETRKLARRFDGRLFPKAQAHLFEELQKRGVLASFTYTRLAMQTRFHLSLEEQQHVDRFAKLPTAALERLGLIDERNDKIVEAIARSNEQSALVFGTSVKHACRLAARLNLLGVKAAAVTGETDRNSRRWFIEAFRRGDIRVLCNHSALTTGFDAPATDLIVIARPVFSPSLYMQMVGRGLRGPVNGGKDKCRILTVQDNLDQYTGKLAHHYFEQYYVGS